MNKDKTSTKVNIEDVIEEYRELIKEYEQPTDDELILKLQKLDSASRNIMILYIASGYKYGITARALCTNISFCKRTIEQIRQKILNIEL